MKFYHVYTIFLFTQFEFLFAQYLTDGETYGNIQEINNHPNFDFLDIGCGHAVEHDDPYYATARRRIYNGQVAELHEYPWMIPFYVSNETLEKGYPICAGSIITDRVIVTSARCCRNLPAPTLNYEKNNLRTILNAKSWAQAGAHDTRDSNKDCKIPTLPIEEQDKHCKSKKPLNYEILGINPHPNYDPYESKNDICLVYTKEQLDFWSPYVAPICLPYFNFFKDRNYTNIQLRSAGWGATNDSNFMLRMRSDILNRGFMRVRSQEVCELYFPWVREKDHICAGGRIFVIDGFASVTNRACRGDTGSPLMARHKFADYVNGRYIHYLMGVDSRGHEENCSRPWPEIYTKVINYVTWILDNIDINNIMKQNPL